jgi:exodeoxyribonuclease VII large subunit
MSRKVVPVSRLVRYLKEYMDSDPVLHGVMIEGEISNLRIPNSGHWYFSIKDDKASLTCCMFAYQNRKITFKPKNGDKVILVGDVTVYEAYGSVQMVATNMQPSGIGELYLKLEELKKKLYQEGLFNEANKQSLPKYPMDIALVTGKDTAARKDVLITFHNRWPVAHITEYPAPVQGKDAANKIIESLKQAESGNHEVIILARGGGSLEDLWCFNDENLARFIFQMHTPVVTGVGHETDTTIVDYVSDVRANTPTGAVEVTTPDIHEVLASLDQSKIRLVNSMKSKIQKEKREINRYADSSVFKNPHKLLNEKIVQLDFMNERLMKYQSYLKEDRLELNRILSLFHHKMHSVSTDISNELKDKRSSLIIYTNHLTDSKKHKLDNYENRLLNSIQINLNRYQNQTNKMIQLLDAYSPLKVLSRGYSVTYKNDKVITSVDDIQIEDKLTIRLSNGTLVTKVEEIKDGK